MNERTAIKERLRKKEQEIQNLEEKLRAARVYAQALQDVLKMLERSPDEPAAAETVLRAGSMVSQARDVILKMGKPAHVDELLQAMGKDMSRDNRASLTSSLAAYVRRGEIFTRPAPNTYGLSELGHATIADEELPSPPRGFGLEIPVDDDDEEIPF